MDKVFIEGLEIEALIGIYDWERRIRQPLVFDLEMQFDNRVPAASDAIADTLDYKAVSKRVIEYVGQSQFGLVETLAERVAAIVLDEFGVERVRLKLSKPGAVRGARAVGVMIERTRQPGARVAQPAQADSVADTVVAPAPEAAAPVATSASEAVEPMASAAAPEAEVVDQREIVAAAAAVGFDATHVEGGAAAPAPTGADGIDRMAAGEAGPSPLEAAMMAALSGWHAPRPAGLQESPDDDHGVGPAAAEVAAESAEAPAEAPVEASAEASDEAPAGGATEAPPQDAAEAWADAPADAPADATAAGSLAETPAADSAEAAADAAEAPEEAQAETPAEAPAEAETTLPPITGPVEYERYADRPRTLAASVARKSAEAAAAATSARANFMRDLDEAPVRPVSVPAPGEPDSLPPAATDGDTDAAAAQPGEVPGSDVAPAVAAADLAHDAAPSADAVESASAADAASPTSAPDAGSTTQSDADIVPTAAAPTRAGPPPPPRPRNPASDLGRTTRPAYLSLGSNIEPEQNLRSALMALRARFGEVIVSPVYRMPAVGFEGPDFLNAAAIIDSDLDPFALTRWLHGIESAHGRMRTHVKNSSRTLDMDIIFFDDLVLDMPGGLQLPRPELRHAFVLKPMVDIAPGFVDPVRGVYLADLWASHPEREQRFSTVMI